MAVLPIDQAAEQNDRSRRNWGRIKVQGVTNLVAVSTPLVINGSNQIALQLLSAGGLHISGSSLAVLLDTNPALVLGAGGIKLLLAAGAPLTTTGGLNVVVDNSTIKITGGQLVIGSLTTKGDLLAYGTSVTRQPIGSNNALLMADSTQANGMRWASRRVGTALLSGGTVTVADASVTANTVILYAVKTAGGTQGFLSTTRVAGTSFTINSSVALDTSTIAYELIEP